MSTSALDHQATCQGLRELSDAEMQAVTGGWWGLVAYIAQTQLAAEAQEQKVMDFLNTKISPKK